MYRRTATLVDAIPFDKGDPAKVVEWVQNNGGRAYDHGPHGVLIADHTNVILKALPGCWITRTVGGKFRVYTNDEFREDFQELQLQADIGFDGVRDVAGYDLSWCKSITDQNLINEMIGMEAISTDDSIDGSSWMFKPYPISAFGKLLHTVVEDIRTQNEGVATFTDDAPLFLEIGCGIGAKLLVAEKIFGLRVVGFDYNPTYISNTNELLTYRECLGQAFVSDVYGPSAVQVYRSADIIYLNRPFVQLEMQAKLEQKILDTMRIGAYIILVNYAIKPALSRGTRLVAEDKFAIVLQKAEIHND